MSNSIVFFDIETKPDERFRDMLLENIKPAKNLKDPAKIAADIAEKAVGIDKIMSVDYDTAFPYMVGIKELGKEPVIMSIDEFYAWYLAPGPMQANGSPMLERWKHVTLVGFNSKQFDIPLLISYGIRNDIDLPYKHMKEMCEKFYKGDKHVDLMEAMTFVWGQNKSLDAYLQIYVGAKKKPIDFATCTDEELRDHCIEDLVNTEKFFLKLRHKLVHA